MSLCGNVRISLTHRKMYNPRIYIDYLHSYLYKHKTAYDVYYGLVVSDMCIRVRARTA